MRILWLLDHFTDRAKEKIDEKKESESIDWREFVTALSTFAALLFAVILFPDVVTGENTLLQTVVLPVIGFVLRILTPVSALLAIIYTVAIISRWTRGSSVSVDMSLGRLSALISYASQMLEHQLLHPMDQLMLRVHLAESEDVLKRGMKYASVKSEHDLPEEKEFYEAMEF